MSDTALILRAREGSVLVRRDEITEAYFSDVGLLRAADLEGAAAAQLRMMSRFPNGVPDDLMRLLLRETGQTEVMILTR
jgi:hypothetical protein